MIFSKSILGICIYLYLMAVIAVWGVIWFTGDRWWFGTMLLYGPRWIYVLPLIGFVPMALLWHRRWLWPLCLAATIIAWPLMGLNVPLDFRPDGGEKALRVMTYNMQRRCASNKEFSALLDETAADLVALQGCTKERGQTPTQWFVAQAGESTIVSRFPIARTEIFMRGPDVNGLYCVIDTPDGSLGFACVDLLTPRQALKPVLNKSKLFDFYQAEHAQTLIKLRWRESTLLSDWIDSFPEKRKIIAGNLNLSVESNIYRNIWSDYLNAYSESEFGYGHAKHTKISIFNYTARIDHILSTSQFRPLHSWVGPDYGSDHRPLLADFATN